MIAQLRQAECVRDINSSIEAACDNNIKTSIELEEGCDNNIETRLRQL